MNAGRPVNPLARDRLGRPVSDDSPDRAEHGVAVDDARDAYDTVIVAEHLLARGFPFAAHEVFEARWKLCPPNERELWQGLAQWCVAVTHAERGNSIGADRLRQRSLGHLAAPDAAAAASRIGIDLRSLIAWLASPVPELPTILHRESGSEGKGVLSAP
jgi:uncharacterized protein